MDTASHPLEGKRILVTRAREQSENLVRALEQMGAEVLLMPTVCFASPEDWTPVDAALRQFSEFDWVLFTSQNAVGFFCQRCRELELDRAVLHLAKPLVAVVGAATAQAAQRKGLRVDYVAKESTGAALGRELRESLAERHVLLPKSDRADDRLPDALREAGARVTEVVTYRTAAPESLDPDVLARLRRGDMDVITFASPSAFHNLAGFIGPDEIVALSRSVPFAVIGPTTAQALRQAGARAAIEATETSAACLADSIAKYYERQPAAARNS